jgi:hypothetical protein
VPHIPKFGDASKSPTGDVSSPLEMRIPEVQNLPKNQKFPQGVFSPTTDLLYFKRKTQVKTCNSFLPFVNVRTTSEFFLFVLFSSGSKQPNQVKLI